MIQSWIDIVIGILHDSILNRYCNWCPTWFNLERMLELASYMIQSWIDIVIGVLHDSTEMDVGIEILHDSTRMDIVIGVLHDSIDNGYFNSNIHFCWVM